MPDAEQSVRRAIGRAAAGVARRLWPDTLFARFFRLQLLSLALVIGVFWALFAVGQARSAMENVADGWAPAILASGPVDTAAAGERRVTGAAPSVSIVRGVPPDDAYAPHWTHLRWRALQDALRERGVPVDVLRVSGRTGQATVWLGTRSPDPGPMRWLGVRSNLEGADFPARWSAAIALALAIVAAAAWRFSRRVAVPLTQLQDAMRAFAADRPVHAATARAPAEIRALSAAFARMARERTDLDAQRALMLAGISHDIRSPLARIRMAAELLDQPCEVAASRERIVRNVGVANDLVESFSDYVRAEAEPMSEPVDLARLAASIAEAEGIECDLAQVAGPTCVRGNERLLRRALDNLVDNAKRHGAPPVTIVVEAPAAGVRASEIRIAVSDRGPGIAPADRERLLRPFERGDAARGTSGSGLGLAIARRVAERHGGRLELRSEADGAFVCALCLPLRGE